MAAGQEIASALGSLTATIQQYAKAQRDSIDDMRDIFEERTIMLTGEKMNDVKKREMQRKKELDAAEEGVKAAFKLTGALDDLQRAVATGAISETDARNKMKEAINDALIHTSQMTDKQRHQLSVMRDMIDKGRDVSRLLPAAENMLKKLGKQQVEYYNKQAMIVKQSEKMVKALANFEESMKAAIKNTFSLSNAMALMSKGFTQSFDEIQYSLQNQVPIINSMSVGFREAAAAYGLSTMKLMETQNEYSVAMLAAANGVGGMTGAAQNAMKEFGPLRDSLYNLTGNFDDAFKLMAGAREALSFAGVRLSSQEFQQQMAGPGGVIDNMKTLATLSGKSAAEIGEMTKQMMKDREMRFTMLGLDRKQRANRMNEILKYQQLLVSKGMEIEQAQEAAMAFEKLNAQVSPKERYKQAAKIRGIAGAMGVAGGERAMALSMKPPSKWSEEDKAFMQKFSTQMEEKMGGLAGGGISQQFLGGAFQEAMGGPVYDAMMKNSTAGLEEGRSVGQDTVDAIKAQTNQLAPIQEGMKEMMALFQRVVAWGSDAGVYLAGGVAAGIGAMVLSLISANKYLAIIAASSGGGGALGAGVGKLGKVGGMLARGGVWGLGAATAGAAGYAAGTAINKAPELLGFDSISTNIVDGLERIFGSKADEGEAAYQQKMKELKEEKAKKESLSAVDQEALKKVANALEKQTKVLEQQGVAGQALAKALEENSKTTKENTEAGKEPVVSYSPPSNRSNFK